MVLDSEVGDYSDVIVKSPFGDIPWAKLSRLSDYEMKLLMNDAVNKTYRFLRVLFDERTCGELTLRLDERHLVPRWDDPS